MPSCSIQVLVKIVLWMQRGTISNENTVKFVYINLYIFVYSDNTRCCTYLISCIQLHLCVVTSSSFDILICKNSALTRYLKGHLRSIHTHFVHSVSNSTVDHFDNSLDQCICFLEQLFNDEVAPHLTMHMIRSQMHGFLESKHPLQKNKCIDRVYIKVIDHRIWDRMDKMNWPLCILHWGRSVKNLDYEYLWPILSKWDSSVHMVKIELLV